MLFYYDSMLFYYDSMLFNRKHNFVKNLPGFGVFTTKKFATGDFLLQYPGDLITKEEAEERDAKYKEQQKGCFLYMFKDANKEFW